MKRIVVGVDGSSESVEAAAWAAALAAALDAELVVVHAFVPVQSEIRPETFERLRREHADRARDWCGQRLEGSRHRVEARDGDPRDVLPAAVDEHEADALVVASTGLSGRSPGFLRLGSVVEHLAHNVDHPLVVVTPGVSTSLRRILVAVDGSPHSRSAVLWARTAAEATGASVTALAVEEEQAQIAAATDDAAWQRAAEEVVAGDWAAPLAHLGERFRPRASRELPVADTIVETAAAEEADVMVLGARGVGDITGVRMGGVAFATLHQTDRPIVIVPPVEDDVPPAGTDA